MDNYSYFLDAFDRILQWQPKKWRMKTYRTWYIQLLQRKQMQNYIKNIYTYTRQYLILCSSENKLWHQHRRWNHKTMNQSSALYLVNMRVLWSNYVYLFIFVILFMPPDLLYLFQRFKTLISKNIFLARQIPLWFFFLSHDQFYIWKVFLYKSTEFCKAHMTISVMPANLKDVWSS